MTDALAVVGRVRKPHGIHGELVVETLCDEPGAMFAPGRRLFVHGEGAPAEVCVARARPFKDGLLVLFDGITDRNAAEAWRAREFVVPQSELAPADAGEVYVHELHGMRVINARNGGADIGTVREVMRVPQGFILDVDTGRGMVSIPFVDAIVVNVDRDARVVTVDPPDGLLEL